LAAEIEATCAEIVAGGSVDQFPVNVFQGCAGTSTNLNINEVIANRSIENIRFVRGDYARLHPNSHVTAMLL